MCALDQAAAIEEGGWFGGGGIQGCFAAGWRRGFAVASIAEQPDLVGARTRMRDAHSAPGIPTAIVDALVCTTDAGASIMIARLVGFPCPWFRRGCLLRGCNARWRGGAILAEQCFLLVCRLAAFDATLVLGVPATLVDAVLGAHNPVATICRGLSIRGLSFSRPSMRCCSLYLAIDFIGPVLAISCIVANPIFFDALLACCAREHA